MTRGGWGTVGHRGTGHPTTHPTMCQQPRAALWGTGACPTTPRLASNYAGFPGACPTPPTGAGRGVPRPVGAAGGAPHRPRPRPGAEAMASTSTD